MKKAAVYLRVSTDEQSTSLQIDAIKKYCEYHNLEFDVFEDKISGAKTSRPALDRLMKKIEAGEYSRLIVWRLDRLTRSLGHLARLILELKKSECDFVSVSESIDLSTPVGRLMIHLLGSFAEFERELIKERVTNGMAAAKKRGTKFGAKPRAFDMKKFNDLRASGMTMGAIAKRMGFSRSQLFARLSAH